jgi:outer membrane receptor protein involved in Fe transport
MLKTIQQTEVQANAKPDFKRKTLAIACLAVSTLPMAAYAQEGGSQQLEEVVVTARGAAESERDIPVAVEAFNAESLRKMNLNSMEAVAANTPSMTIVRAGEGSGATINIRGVGSTFSSIGI